MKTIILTLLVSGVILAQEGLQLTEAQRSQIQQIRKEEREEIERIRKQARERMETVLTPEQLNKVKERREERELRRGFRRF